MGFISAVKGFLFSSKEETKSDYLANAKKVLTNDMQFELDATKESKEYINKLQKLVDLSNGTIYHEKFKKILDITTKIHNKFVDENLPKLKLAQFHIYRTATFIDVFEDLLKPLNVEEINIVKESVKVAPAYTLNDINGRKVDDVVSFIMKKLEFKPLKKAKSVDEKASNGRTYGENYVRKFVSSFFSEDRTYYYDTMYESRFLGESGDYIVLYRKSAYYDTSHIFIINLESKKNKIVYHIIYDNEVILDLLNSELPVKELLLTKKMNVDEK